MLFLKQLLNKKEAQQNNAGSFNQAFANLWRDYCHARQLSVDAYCWGTPSKR